jgi:uncharacterized protein YqeY
MKLQQDNHDKLTVITNEETIVKVCKKMFRWRKEVYKRFTQLGSGDYDRVIYQIYQINNWGKKI